MRARGGGCPSAGGCPSIVELSPSHWWAPLGGGPVRHAGERRKDRVLSTMLLRPCFVARKGREGGAPGGNRWFRRVEGGEVRGMGAQMATDTHASFNTMRFEGRDSASGTGRKLSIIRPGATTVVAPDSVGSCRALGEAGSAARMRGRVRARPWRVRIGVANGAEARRATMLYFGEASDGFAEHCAGPQCPWLRRLQFRR